MSKGTRSIVNGDLPESVSNTPEDIAKFKRSRDSALADNLVSVSNGFNASVIHLEGPRKYGKSARHSSIAFHLQL